MRHSLILAWRYLTWNKAKTLTLIACVTLTLFLPVAMQRLLTAFEAEMTARAKTTPIVIGAKGSRFDLSLHALYFRARTPGEATMADHKSLADFDLAESAPIFSRFQARGFPIVGTTLDYFDLRGLRVAQGDSLTVLGDCVVGANVANELKLKPGDRLMSDPENMFDIAGTYPLNMRVAGILAKTWTPDDDAVLVDLKTAWIIQGIGHGHQDLETAEDADVILDREDKNIVANAALPTYTEITDANVDSFHFHAEPEELPLTAILAWPRDVKSQTLLLGRYQSTGSQLQALQSEAIIEEMLALVFRVRRAFDACHLFMAVTTGLFLALTILLSLRLRRREMETLFQLGCAKFTTARLLACELGIIVVISLALTAVLLAVSSGPLENILHRMILGA